MRLTLRMAVNPMKSPELWNSKKFRKSSQCLEKVQSLQRLPISTESNYTRPTGIYLINFCSPKQTIEPMNTVEASKTATDYSMRLFVRSEKFLPSTGQVSASHPMGYLTIWVLRITGNSSLMWPSNSINMAYL